MPADIADMLLRIRREKKAESQLELKNAIGGIREIEFIAQKIFLTRKTPDAINGHLIGEMLTATMSETDAEGATFLANTYDYFLAIHQQMAVRTADAGATADLRKPSFLMT